jgi:hypothetical protein
MPAHRKQRTYMGMPLYTCTRADNPTQAEVALPVYNTETIGSDL